MLLLLVFNSLIAHAILQGTGTPSCSDPNACPAPNNCASPCQPTCDKPYIERCTDQCILDACVCISGYILDKYNGKCIPEEKCPGSGTPSCLDPNACPAPNNCASPCQPTCEKPIIEVCTDQCILDACVCISGYILDKYNGKCIPEEKCPGSDPSCPDNEVYDCRFSCGPDTCPTKDVKYNCLETKNCTSKCYCKDGYYRNGTSSDCPCIPGELCPPLQTEPGDLKPVGPNEIFKSCRSICPPQTCVSIVSSYDCYPFRCVCEPGFDCLPGYLRNGNESSACVPSEECKSPGSDPACPDPNASRVECASLCVDTCANRLDTGRPCAQGCEVNGCQCNPGFVLSGPGGSCIPISQCPDTPQCSASNTCPAPNNCASPCQPTCDNKSYDVCTEQCIPDTCVCASGYILDKYNGTCIPEDKCPGSDTLVCSDPNASPIDCASICQPTCDNPEFEQCADVCQPRCVCNTGYILDQSNGTCIPINECPNNPCGDFAFISSCKVNCSSDYCPTTDSLDQVSCDPGSDCRPGCVCRVGFRRLSVDDPTCIPAEQCPAIDCTRSFEAFNPCPNQCLTGFCDDVGRENNTCNTLVQNCQPQCACIDGYFRSRSTRLCISREECNVA